MDFGFPGGPDVQSETELKLRLAPDAMRRLRRHAVVQGLKKGRPVTESLKSVYFDTDDHCLRKRAMALRVRHAGRRRIQTLKTEGTLLNGASVRGEWEAEISGDAPELAALKAAEPASDLADERWVRSLRPVFTTEVRRTTYNLGDGDWDIELALDEGLLVSAGGSAPIAEVELELKRGEPRRLFDLALRLQQDVPARLSTISKSERGYLLVDGGVLAPRKARAPALPADADVALAFRLIARSCVDQLLGNQDCLFEARDPEAVHQMRVALRRLSSAFKLFAEILGTPEAARLREELRWLSARLGPARDAEVFMMEIIAPLTPVFGADPEFQALRAEFEAARVATFADALAALAEPRFTQFVLALAAWIEGGDWLTIADEESRGRLALPARAMAGATLDRLDRSLRKRLRRLASLDAEERHRARIRAKRLRYAVEFFAPLYAAGRARRLNHALARLQDQLGHLNDIAVASRTLRSHAERAADPALLWTAGQMAGWHAARIPGLLAAAEEDRRALQKLPRFWRDEG